MEEPHTHPIPHTLPRIEASYLAVKAAEEVVNVVKPEELYATLEKYLDLARLEGTR